MKEKKGIKWPDLIRGTLIKRYKRFLADVRLDDKSVITAHCPNSGSMKACSEPGRPVYLSLHDNPRRKLKYTWELIEMPGSLVGVNTNIPNKLIKLSVENGYIKELSGYDRVRPEVRTSAHTRLDLVLEKEDRGKACYVEVKNCTLVEDGVAFFPDAVTTRGQKHLFELQRLIQDGHRAVMVYLIQRMDARCFSPADHIDAVYGKALREVMQSGVEAYVYDVHISLDRIVLNKPVNIKF
ncbi:MAG: DNA/RNA nuclease SfsA [Thermodesulfobacteriota bacterium]|nr:DNA/RNA nuclease SfsA [Thermodesulfobacteriota bacterium]